MYVYRTGPGLYYGNPSHHHLRYEQLTKITDENNKVVQVIETKANVYPEYYLIEVERFEDVIKEDIDEWIYFFKNEEIKEEFHSRNIQKAKEKLKLLTMSEVERKIYEKYLIHLVSERDAIETARNEGEIKGETKGRIEGKIESLLEVLEELGSIPEALENRVKNQKKPIRVIRCATPS